MHRLVCHGCNHHIAHPWHTRIAWIAEPDGSASSLCFAHPWCWSGIADGGKDLHVRGVVEFLHPHERLFPSPKADRAVVLKMIDQLERAFYSSVASYTEARRAALLSGDVR